MNGCVRKPKPSIKEHRAHDESNGCGESVLPINVTNAKASGARRFDSGKENANRNETDYCNAVPHCELLPAHFAAFPSATAAASRGL
jgi:hypothetical protein